jgi:hypothetical protein
MPRGHSQSTSRSSAPACERGNLDEEPRATKATITSFFNRLKVAIAQDKRAVVADMMSYPVLTTSIDGTRRRIRSREYFLRSYDQVLPTNERQFILRQDAVCIGRVGAQGFSIGRGELWFDIFPDGKVRIFTINPLD